MLAPHRRAPALSDILDINVTYEVTLSHGSDEMVGHTGDTSAAVHHQQTATLVVFQRVIVESSAAF